ncbi:MAG TPA: PilZ domain-containing protein [Planctomycetota bacterium]|nr:PilZ domain-containing protein [Planctomycetota bacterium]
MAESLPGSTPVQKTPSDKAIAVSADKREHPRFKVDGATASVGKPGFLATLGLGPIQHAVINLSQGGAMIRLGKRLPVESRHELRIEVPKYKEVIVAVGEIRWCLASAKNERDLYAGVRFVDLPAAERRKLAGMYELFTSAEYKAKAAVRKDASSVHLKAPRL